MITRALVFATEATSVADNRGDRIVALLLLLAIIGALAWFGGRPSRPPRLLGSLRSDRESPAAEERVEVRGVGRFARPRTL